MEMIYVDYDGRNSSGGGSALLFFKFFRQKQKIGNGDSLWGWASLEVVWWLHAWTIGVQHQLTRSGW